MLYLFLPDSSTNTASLQKSEEQENDENSKRDVNVHGQQKFAAIIREKESLVVAFVSVAAFALDV